MEIHTERVSRRDLLRGSLLVGGAVAGAVALPGVAGARVPAAGVSPSTASAPPAGLTLFADPALDFNARFALGAAGYGSAEVGEVVTAVNAANAAGGDLDAFVDAFRSLADRTVTLAQDATDRKDVVTAREAHLRAAEYYTQMLFFVLGTPTPADEPKVFRQVRAHWEAYCRLAEPRILKVQIPYGRTTIPGYFLRPDDSGKARPTVIVNNGSDGQSVETFAYGGAAAVARGYNALIFEGPGQGEMLFLRKIPFRPDWEKVITPIVSWLRKRSDVDEDRIALTGWSLGGGLVIRAAAFEHRLAAVVADPGFVDIWRAWPDVIRNVQQAGDARAQNQLWNDGIVPVMTPAQTFSVKKRAEIFARSFLDDARAGKVFSDYARFAALISQYRCGDVAHLVRSPILVTEYELDQFVPGQPQEVYALLHRPKGYASFTAAQGAQYHCAPMAPQLRNEVVFDWLAEQLR